MKTIDLNCDMGEGYGAYEIGQDDAMLEVVSTINLACGFHAGDFSIMSRLCREAATRGVAVGAHPGYPDLWGFGRRKMAFSDADLENIFAYQIGAAQAVARLNGHMLTHVKAHGALGHLVADEPRIGELFARVVARLDDALFVTSMTPRGFGDIAARAGLRVAHEIYADRAYMDDGRLMPRGQPGAVIHDAQEAVRRVLEMAEGRCIITATGKRIPAPVDSICVHGDSPQALPIARAIRDALEAAGWRIQPFCRA
ncbi:5-oxoprolinase subunit PxpA [Orrella sp. JC864]|uniref:LamB/YcsF family protein n=1 Tax=Orrella sp. JC864 TaxID=3120298 RepID=UPI00300A42E7